MDTSFAGTNVYNSGWHATLRFPASWTRGTSMPHQYPIVLCVGADIQLLTMADVGVFEDADEEHDYPPRLSFAFGRRRMRLSDDSMEELCAGKYLVALPATIEADFVSYLREYCGNACDLWTRYIQPWLNDWWLPGSLAEEQEEILRAVELVRGVLGMFIALSGLSPLQQAFASIYLAERFPL